MEQKDTALEIAYFINDCEELTDFFMKAQNAMREHLEKGAKFFTFNWLGLPEFFELRVKANRKVIDKLKIYPTKKELDDALEMSAEVMLDNICAFEDITNPDFNS